MKTNIFGTDGIREKVGAEFLTPPSLHELGRSIAQWAKQKINRTPHILIGHDTRESCYFIKSALASGLLLEGSHIYDAHIAPTPAICQIVKKPSHFDFGIIISASHNPYYDNGIKIVCAQNGKISADDEAVISSLFYTSKKIEYDHLGKTYHWPYAVSEYKNKIISFFQSLFLKDKKIVLDCAHGATFIFAQEIFSYFGAQMILINNEPNGKNINEHCGSLHLESLQQAIIFHNADIGFAFDGDGDRVIAVNSNGDTKDGDDILALLIQHDNYIQEKKIVGTIMTNQGFAYYLQTNNKTLHRTAVGDKYISEHLVHNDLFLGGEPSGHIIMKDYMESGDGIFTALRLLEVIIKTNNWAMNSFQKFPQVLINVPVSIKKDLSSPELAQIIFEYNAQVQKGRLIVRYSGTEPLLRVMVEDEDMHNAQKVGAQLAHTLLQQLT